MTVFYHIVISFARGFNCFLRFFIKTAYKQQENIIRTYTSYRSTKLTVFQFLQKSLPFSFLLLFIITNKYQNFRIDFFIRYTPYSTHFQKCG